jgi:hypothetical protein
MSTSLPTGRAGQALALAILAGLVVLIWSVVIAPLSQWYGERADLLGEQQILARRMTDIAASLGDARRLAATGSAGRAATTAVRGGSTDAVAGATLQQLVQGMATREGAVLPSIETLPAVQAGAYRRIGLRVSLSAPWPVLIGLLHAIDEATPRMLIDDLQIHGPRMVANPVDRPLESSITIYAYRAAAPEPRRP